MTTSCQVEADASLTDRSLLTSPSLSAQLCSSYSQWMVTVLWKPSTWRLCVCLMTPCPLGLSVTSLAGELQRQVSLAIQSPKTHVSHINLKRKGSTWSQCYIKKCIIKRKTLPHLSSSSLTSSPPRSLLWYPCPRPLPLDPLLSSIIDPLTMETFLLP